MCVTYCGTGDNGNAAVLLANGTHDVVEMLQVFELMLLVSEEEQVLFRSERDARVTCPLFRESLCDFDQGHEWAKACSEIRATSTKQVISARAYH